LTVQGSAQWPAYTVRERLTLQRYLDSLEKADEELQTNIDQSAVEAALEKLKQNPEPEAGGLVESRTTNMRPL
jgi:transposase